MKERKLINTGNNWKVVIRTFDDDEVIGYIAETREPVQATETREHDLYTEEITVFRTRGSAMIYKTRMMVIKRETADAAT